MERISAHGLASRADLAWLREAVAADRVRRVRMPTEAVLSAWRALHGGRWSIVALVERDGRRLLVARPNAPLRNGPSLAPTETANHRQPETANHRQPETANHRQPEPPGQPETTNHRQPEPPRRLSAQESRVLIALAKGHTNKLIAYELGLATSTVGTLLARAARKLGCKTRIELARVGRALTHHSASEQSAKEPA